MNAILATPVAIPKATPVATACISKFFLKAPTVIFSTVDPKAFKAGSAKVAPYPKINPNKIEVPVCEGEACEDIRG